jgi:hypothetical protein
MILHGLASNGDLALKKFCASAEAEVVGYAGRDTSGEVARDDILPGESTTIPVLFRFIYLVF